MEIVFFMIFKLLLNRKLLAALFTLEGAFGIMDKFGVHFKLVAYLKFPTASVAFEYGGVQCLPKSEYGIKTYLGQDRQSLVSFSRLIDSANLIKNVAIFVLIMHKYLGQYLHSQGVPNLRF